MMDCSLNSPGRCLKIIDTLRTSVTDALNHQTNLTYNTEHHHSGLGWLTPQVVHGGQSAAVLAARQKVLNQAFRTTPERFVRKPPQPPRLLDKVWINPPDPKGPE